MKVGSSSLFFLPGQEEQLENFVQYLNQKEKEAQSLIKKQGILFDDVQDPAIRVALRAIKDFAIPLKVKINEEHKIVWKYYLLNEPEVDSLLQKSINPTKETRKEPEEQAKTEQKEQQSQKETEKTQKKEKKKTKTESSEFPQHVKNFIASREIELIAAHLEKKKELLGLVRADSPFGKQEYYLIARDKKKVTEQDLEFALEKAQKERMPALLIFPGELDRKASMKSIELRNLIKCIRMA
jgi:hypothetical protein